ncbi:MAG: hypothetical protein H6Q14_1685 [Bacteroidetes bacterium]|nr:hypothetical protein [Bacteroidota bacterium]
MFNSLNDTILQATLPTYQPFTYSSFLRVFCFVMLVHNLFDSSFRLFLTHPQQRGDCMYNPLFSKKQRLSFFDIKAEVQSRLSRSLFVYFSRIIVQSSDECRMEGKMPDRFATQYARHLSLNLFLIFILLVTFFKKDFTAFLVFNNTNPIQRKSLLGIFPLFLTQSSYSAFFLMRYKTAKFNQIIYMLNLMRYFLDSSCV